MRQIKEVLRLHHEAQLSERQIAHACRVSRSTVQRYLERAAAAALNWPLPDSLDDIQLERLLFPPPPADAETSGPQPGKAQPDFVKVHQELTASKSVTLQLLWQEYIEDHPDGAHYSWFCEQYRLWARHLDVVGIPTMSISHSDLMPIRAERSDAGLSQCETVIDIRQ